MARRGLVRLLAGVLLFLSLSGTSSRARLALAEAPIRILENAHAVTFGREMRFILEAESEQPITSVVLAYRTSDTGGTTVETPLVAPDAHVHLEFVHEMSRRYVRPFVQVTYWWTIVDAGQARLVTEPRGFTYADDRYDWQTLNGETATVHWYRGSLEVAQQSLDVAEEGLRRAREEIAPNGYAGGMDVYLYASRGDLLTALPPGSPPDVEALTLNGMNVVLVSFPPEEAYIPDLQRLLPHEATHALIHTVAQDAHDRVPMWLSEGLATSVQYAFAPDPVAQTLLQEAVRQDELIPLLDLCAAFPRDAADAHLAYAESANVLAYVKDRYGLAAMRDLIAAYADGATCEGGVYRVLRITLDGLEGQWRSSLAPQAKWVTFWRTNGSWIILLLLITAFPLAFVLPLRKGGAAMKEKSP